MRNILLHAAAEAPSPAHFTKVARAAVDGQIIYCWVWSCLEGVGEFKPSLIYTSSTSRSSRDYALGSGDVFISNIERMLSL
jgi:hypothetical protein